MNKINFPENFLFGVATSSYQVEGAAFEDGRTSCIWDDFSKKPGCVKNNQSGLVSVDQYHRYKEDVALMAKLNVKAYRFSVSWSRVLPNDGEKINKKGVEYYRNLCKELHKYGIKACCTIYHWDLPSELQERGGWTNRETAYRYQRYAEVLYRELGDLVDMWFTINEPCCIAILSYLYGLHAPGYKDVDKTIQAIHHINLAHGLALDSYRKTGLKAPIGLAVDAKYPLPYSSNKNDLLACAQKTALETESFLGPYFGHGYPEYLTKTLGWKFPVEDGDMELIGKRPDFLGINYYFEQILQWSDTELCNAYSTEFKGRKTGGMNWPVTPSGLKRLLTWVDSYTDHIPMYITENGSAEIDTLNSDGTVKDTERTDYLKQHLEVLSETIKSGINIKGYFYWSFIDNFEWAEGYDPRFGLVYCDYKTLKRYPKYSALYYRDIIAQNS